MLIPVKIWNLKMEFFEENLLFDNQYGETKADAFFRASARFPDLALASHLQSYADPRARRMERPSADMQIIVPNGENQLIFRYCRSGNLAGMQRLFRSGAATPLDINGEWAPADTLLEVGPARSAIQGVIVLLLDCTCRSQRHTWAAGSPAVSSLARLPGRITAWF